jgi:CheY-like chemotaxis protein
LIVDDEPEIDQTLKELFEESGYPILSASNGEEALRILRDCPERLIILLDGYYARTGR